MDENKQAILLLAAHFSAPGDGVYTPLTAIEYGRFAAWIKQAGLQPRDLFHQLDEMLAKWHDPKGKVTAERLRYLLGRGMAMGIAMEKWERAGMWVLTRSDQEYPRRLKKYLAEAAPDLQVIELEASTARCVVWCGGESVTEFWRLSDGRFARHRSARN